MSRAMSSTRVTFCRCSECELASQIWGRGAPTSRCSRCLRYGATMRLHQVGRYSKQEVHASQRIQANVSKKVAVSLMLCRVAKNARRRRGFAEKFGLGRKFKPEHTYIYILSQIKICRDLRTFWRSVGKNQRLLGSKTVFLGQEVHY